MLRIGAENLSKVFGTDTFLENGVTGLLQAYEKHGVGLSSHAGT